jgi:excisionase family DNA binding protein
LAVNVSEKKDSSDREGGPQVYLMSVEELAEYLGESKRTVYRYIQSGDCPRYIRLTARNIKFDKRDVDAWLESKKVDPKERREKQ